MSNPFEKTTDELAQELDLALTVLIQRARMGNRTAYKAVQSFKIQIEANWDAIVKSQFS